MDHTVPFFRHCLPWEFFRFWSTPVQLIIIINIVSNRKYDSHRKKNLGTLNGPKMQQDGELCIYVSKRNARNAGQRIKKSININMSAVS